MTTFDADYMDALIGCLKKAHKEGPKARPFDPALAQRAIESFKRRLLSEPAGDRIIETADTRRERAAAIQTTAKQLHTLLRGAVRDGPEGIRWGTGDDILSALVEGATAVPDPIEAWGRAWSRVEQALAAIAEIEAAAQAVVRKYPTRGRGRQLGHGALPPEHIKHLAFVYSTITGRDPKGHRDRTFAEFVQCMGTAIGLPDNYDVVEAIKRAQPNYRAPPSRQRGARRVASIGAQSG